MGKIIYLPLEDLEQRYNVMMNRAIKDYCDYYLYPEIEGYQVITNGQFLDITRTIEFKAKQLVMVSQLFTEGKIKDGDCFLVGDIFFPGIESIRYMAELLEIDVYIFGFNYAGRSDSQDFVRQLGVWSDSSERGYHDICDIVFVGSEFHKENVESYFKGIKPIILPTGYVWDSMYPLSFQRHVEKEDFIIWPHRLCSEKGVGDLLEFSRMTTKQIVITSCGNRNQLFDSWEWPENVHYLHNLTKAEYYNLIARAKWYLSTGHQETFGYTIQEALLYNCVIAAPNRACYSEMVRSRSIYNHINEIDSILDNGYVEEQLPFIFKYDNNINEIIGMIKRFKR